MKQKLYKLSIGKDREVETIHKAQHSVWNCGQSSR